MPKKSSENQQVPEPEEEEIKIINFNTFDIENRFALKAGLKADQEKSTQNMSFPKYSFNENENGNYDSIVVNGTAPIFVTDEIVMNKGGIPKYNQLYHASADDMKRAYFYIAEDESCRGSVDLFDFIKTIDEYYTRKINIENNEDNVVSYMFKNKQGKLVRRPYKGLTYKPIIGMTKKPVNDDDAPS